jgi:hypothetical protein
LGGKPGYASFNTGMYPDYRPDFGTEIHAFFYCKLEYKEAIAFTMTLIVTIEQPDRIQPDFYDPYFRILGKRTLEGLKPCYGKQGWKYRY